jgi:aspartyl-tRNA(Asn)/glutamyl-tRNA(Gln) amidotransferase subunit C
MTRDEVARVAALARIALAPDEIDRLVGELGIIVSSVASVSEVATADVPATSHPLPLVNVLRADVPEPALSQAEALAGAPAAEDGKFLVPQILGEEGSAGE